MYLIYDENGELMRKLRYRAEVKYIIKLYKGWSFKFVPKPKVSLEQFAAALF
jgi:hypothetical protein